MNSVGIYFALLLIAAGGLIELIRRAARKARIMEGGEA